MTNERAGLIEEVRGEEITDSRGNPSIKVTVFADGESGSFSVPSGASTGVHEAHELRDDDGKGVKKALEKMEIISKALAGVNIFDQKEIDRIMIELDGTPNKDNLGGNTMVGVSVACAKTAAKIKKQETYEYLRTLSPITFSHKVPFLFMNLLEGGKHAGNGLAFQEYHVVPKTEDPSESVAIGIAIQNTLKEIIEKEEGEIPVLGDEGGFAPKTKDVRKPLVYLTETIKRNNLENKVGLALDVAASSFFSNGFYEVDGKKISKDELMSLYGALISEFNLFSIEDPFNEEDFESFSIFSSNHDKLKVVGDDLTVSNKILLKKAIEKGSVNALIIKPNQIGTLTETLETMSLARENGIEIIVSHRSGETEDDFVADLAFAFGCFGLKAGSPLKPERMIKYQRLIEISYAQHDFAKSNNMNSKAQIIATIGPATKDKKIIREMAEHCMDVARLNFSWGTYEEHGNYIKNIKEIAEEFGREIPIIQDLSGPREQGKSGHEFDREAGEIFTAKDLADLKFGVAQKIDYVAMSYVGSADDVGKLREEIKKLGADIPIIAKIERAVALKKIDEIIEVADAIMIARGDLGNEIPLEQIPFVEKDIIAKCKTAGKPVIVATQMMISMMESDKPTRAEITDIAFAILNGADAVMLSEESAAGKYPLEAVIMMEKAVKEAEKHSDSIKVNRL